MAEFGIVANVVTTLIGDVLSVAATATDTTLTVVDAVEFDETGGTLQIGVEIIDYLSVDDAAGVITLAEPIASSYEIDERVLLHPNASRTVAMVALGGEDEAVSAQVPHALKDRIPDGIRESDAGEVVSLVLDNFTWTITDVVGSTPVIDGVFIPDVGEAQAAADQAALDAAQAAADAAAALAAAASDGNPPASSPAPTVTGGIGALFARWAGVVNADPVTYAVHLSATSGFTPGAGTLAQTTEGTQVTLRTLPDGTALGYGITYYVKVVASDADGAAAASVEGSDQMVQVTGPDIASDSVTANQIVAGTITGDLFAGSIILGTVFRTAESGQRVEFSNAGIFQYDSAGAPTVSIPNEGDATFSGEIVASGLTVKGGAAFESAANEVAREATLTLAVGTTDPVNAPQAASDWDVTILDRVTNGTGPLGTFPFAPEDVTSVMWDSTIGVICFQKVGTGTREWWFDPTTGDYLSHVDWLDRMIFGRARHPTLTTFTYQLHYRSSDATWHILRDDAGVQLDNFYPRLSVQQPQITWGPNGIAVAEVSSTGTVHIRHMTMGSSGATATVSSTTVTDVSYSGTGLNTLLYGSFDLGVDRWTISPNDVGFLTRTLTTGGIWLEGDSFPSPTGVKKGVLWDGSKFRTLGSNGWLFHHTGTSMLWPTATSDKWWASTTIYDSDAGGTGTHQTKQSPKRMITAQRRSKVVVSTSSPPDLGGVDDPNSWRAYLGRGATEPVLSAMWLNGTSGGPNGEIVVTAPVFSGTNPPSTNNFPAAGPARLKTGALAADSDPRMYVDGDGAGRWGDLEVSAAGDVAIAGGVPGGRIATTVVTADNITTAEETVATVVAALVSGRTYRITFDFAFEPAAAADHAFIRIREDSIAGTEIQLRRLVGGDAATFIGANIETEYTASSTGNKTFVATLARTPTGTVTLNASPARPSFLYVDHVR